MLLVCCSRSPHNRGRRKGSTLTHARTLEGDYRKARTLTDTHIHVNNTGGKRKQLERHKSAITLLWEAFLYHNDVGGAFVVVAVAILCLLHRYCCVCVCRLEHTIPR